MKTAIEYIELFGKKEMIYKFDIGEVVNTPNELKTISVINQSMSNISPFDTFFMKEDCTNIRSGYYSADYNRRDLTPVQ